MIKVRPATRRDRPDLVRLIQAYLAFYRQPMLDSAALDRLFGLLEDRSRGVQLVAEVDGRPIGFASLYACLDTFLADRILVMNDLFVDLGERSQGIGAALFAGCRAYASEHGFKRLDWVTAQDNVGAPRFYDRHGGKRGPWVSYSIVP